MLKADVVPDKFVYMLSVLTVSVLLADAVLPNCRLSKAAYMEVSASYSAGGVSPWGGSDSLIPAIAVASSLSFTWYLTMG